MRLRFIISHRLLPGQRGCARRMIYPRRSLRSSNLCGCGRPAAPFSNNLVGGLRLTSADFVSCGLYSGETGMGESMKSTSVANGGDASASITKRIKELGDWRGETLAQVRELIHAADSDIQEEWKWRGVPVWSHDGIVCTGESYKEVVKLTFARGAALKDPKKLFNSSLEGNTRRAIDLREGEKINEAALKQLIRAAVAANSAALAERAAKKKKK
jgi:hypothetical protein